MKLALLILTLLLPQTTTAQSPNFNIHDPDHSLYSKEGRALIGTISFRGEDSDRKYFPIRVYKKPSRKSKVLLQAELSWYGHLKGREKEFLMPIKLVEVGYENTEIAVFARKKKWFQVEILHPKHHRGWVRMGGAKFKSLKNLLEGKLAHLTRHWSGDLYSAPGSNTAVRTNTIKILGTVMAKKTRPITRIGIYKKPSSNSPPLHYFAHSNVESWIASFNRDHDRKNQPLVKNPTYPWHEREIPVLAKRDGWYQVALPTRFTPLLQKKFAEIPLGEDGIRRVWIPSSNVTPLLRLKEARVLQKARAVLKFKEKDENANTLMGARVEGFKRVKGALWVRVQKVKNQCREKEILQEKGWIPLLNRSGRLNLWFYSRGC